MDIKEFINSSVTDLSFHYAFDFRYNSPLLLNNIKKLNQRLIAIQKLYHHRYLWMDHEK